MKLGAAPINVHTEALVSFDLDDDDDDDEDDDDDDAYATLLILLFSARERIAERGYLNGDGFGLGWYPLPREEKHAKICNVPAVFTR